MMPCGSPFVGELAVKVKRSYEAKTHGYTCSARSLNRSEPDWSSSGRFRSFRGLKKALKQIPSYYQIRKLWLNFCSAVKIKLVAPTAEKVAISMIDGHYYEIYLFDRSRPAAFASRGGRTRGKKKVRGDSQYYSQLAKSRWARRSEAIGERNG
jgi:hypothetical protein